MVQLIGFVFQTMIHRAFLPRFLMDIRAGILGLLLLLTALLKKQFYWPETNVLVTRFLASCGVGEIIDFMPVGMSVSEKGYHWLVRQVRGVRCSMSFRLECYPGFNYGRDQHQTTLISNGACFTSPTLSLGLSTDLLLQQDERGVWTEFTLKAGQSAVFVIQEIEADSRLCTAS